ncbi:MAG: LytTR family transcriptional regulator DNA-binding domain-containing protein [Lachnospiraceae bacterium]|nr:LytTR family transcriptional regulator DNA-binding domain-containing protein [Lachnospiraceae bacterium]
MKVELQRVESAGEESALIRAVEVTENIQYAVDVLENNCRSLPVTRDGETLMVRTDKIYYAESVDKRSYVYTKENCYETKLRLYEMEEQLNANFFRCSKALIINIRKIKSVRSEINGRMIAELLNGEEIVISRSYVKDLKRKLGL